MEDKINIKKVFHKLISKWYYFVIAALITMPLAYAYLKIAQPKYQIKASILLKNEKSGGYGADEFLKGMGLFNSSTDLEDEIGIIKSYANVEAAIRRLNFGISYFTEKNFKPTEYYEETPFTIVLDSAVNQLVGVPIFIERLSGSKYMVQASAKEASTYDVLTNAVKDRVHLIDIQEVVDIDKPFESKNLSFTITFNNAFSLEEGAKMYFIINNLSSMAEGYQNALTIEPISLESNIVQLSIKQAVPQKGVDFLNQVMLVFLENELYKKNQLGLKTIQFIDNQLSGVSDSLKQVEGTLESFRSRNNILDIKTSAENLTNNLDRLETEQAELEVKLQYYRYIATTLQGDAGASDIVAPSTFGVDDPLLSSLLIELSKLNQERSGLNYSAREGNPLAEVIDLKIKNSKRSITENVNNIIDASSIALNDLNRRIAQINAQLQRLPRNERELVKIQRRYDFSDNVYNYLLEKRAEAGIAIASNVVEKAVVDEAMMVGSGPVSPNKRLILAAALVLAFGGALALIILKDFLNDNIVTPDDVEQHTRIPFLGSITHGSRREQSNVVANALSAVGESFRSLRVNLQYLTLGKEINVIGFTSSRESEGKTFCSVNLAAAMANSRRKTILLDADMRRPKVGSYFQLENDKGLSNYLIGESTVKEIINETGIKGFDVIASGPIPPNPLDLIGQPRMGELLNELKQTYNTIIIDSPPIGFVSEYIILMKYTDANIYVVRSDYTTRFNLEKINNMYNERRINNLSILLNDVRTSRLNGYSYSYKYKYKARTVKV
jgi:capsular exopolysaccharide synthesis family protein